MQKYTAKILMAISLLTIGGLTAANAQIESDSVFRINVPFAFEVKNKTLPAGEYQIKATDDLGDAPTLLEIQSLKGPHEGVVFDTVPISLNDAPKKSNIVFDKVGSDYYLSEIWEAGNSNGNQVEEPVNMKKLEKDGMKAEKQVIQTERTKKKATE
ncbi:MAG: hypothetical protein JSS81_27755 [Acidobacteria bacterium]|nr:hypothetical protein [Acidobacteriota bacterium]